MPKVDGIDFSGLQPFRKSAEVILLDGEKITLPLIMTKDAPIATSFIRENDTLALKCEAIANKRALKAQAFEAAAEATTEKEDTVEDTSALIDGTSSLIEFQREMREIYKDFGKLCDEIHEFIRPYFKDSKVIDTLKQLDIKYTVQILELMLYGTAALHKDEDKEENTEERPTTTPSQNS